MIAAVAFAMALGALNAGAAITLLAGRATRLGAVLVAGGALGMLGAVAYRFW
jgi:hypothetical protein